MMIIPLFLSSGRRAHLLNLDDAVAAARPNRPAGNAPVDETVAGLLVLEDKVVLLTARLEDQQLRIVQVVLALIDAPMARLTLQFLLSAMVGRR